jgi:DNA-directed RNA polymerase subunit E'/Rpb7
MVLHANFVCELKIRIEKKMNLLVLDQQIHLFFNSQFTIQKRIQIRNSGKEFRQKNTVRIHLSAGKEFAIGKRMRENKLMLTLTQRSLGAIPVSERRAAEMLKKVVVIAATLLAVSAGADVPLEGSG